MERVKVIAKEISLLVPRMLRGMRAGFLTSQQVTTSQVVTLMRIYEKATTRVGVLSKEMRVSAPTMSGVVDRLVRSGYIKRAYDKADRRVINVELTQKGRKLVEQLLSEINTRWYRILTHLSEEGRENYLRILKRVVEILSKENV